jgi:hypothetical protein
METQMQQWGLSAPEGYTGPRWGARAIYRLESREKVQVKGRKRVRVSQTYADIDIPWDRQAMDGGTEEQRKALADWVNNEGMARLKNQLVEQYVTTICDQEVVIRGNGFVLRANPCESYGYLYIGCYLED